jgi:fibro-slime domain-containing protein
VNGARRDSKNREIMPIKSSFKLGDMVWEDGTDHDKGKGNDKPASGSASAPAPIEWDRSLVSASEGGSLTTAENFAQWFTDVPGVNVSIPVSITLKKAKDSNLYTFDDKTDDQFKPLGGFFPINRQGFGNSAGDNRNFHFTYEVATKFTYRKNSGQVFTFTGDDDVYVFVGGVLVIDLGGVHSAISQSVDLDTLDFLEDGQDYDLRLFFAERHRTQSNMRIETTIELRNAELPQTNSIFD